MNARLFCRSINKGCDLGDIVEIYVNEGDHIRVKVRITDIDTIATIAKKSKIGNEWKDFYSAGGLLAIAETVGRGEYRNCRIEQ